MARKGRGVSGRPRGRPRSPPPRRRVWRRPCGNSVKQVGSGTAATRARGGACPQTLLGVVLARPAAGKWGRGGKQRRGWNNVPLASRPRLRAGDRREDAAQPWILGNAKGKWFSRDSEIWGGQSGRRAPWKLPPRALEPWLFPPCSRVGTRARTLAGQSAWRLPFRAVRVDAALPAAAASSGSRAEWPLRSGIWAAKSRDRQIAAQAAAAEPGGARPSGAARPGYCWFQVQSCALCGLLSSLGI